MSYVRALAGWALHCVATDSRWNRAPSLGRVAPDHPSSADRLARPGRAGYNVPQMAEQRPSWADLLKQVGSFLPPANPTFNNPDFQNAAYRVLIVRLSPFRDVDRSIPHLFLFQEVRRALPHAFIDLALFPSTLERELFDRQGIPYLIGVQSLRPAREFDLVLISNAYTLELVNLPCLLIRSGIPLFSSQRGPEWPLFILGGSNAMATQAVIGEGGGGGGASWCGESAKRRVSQTPNRRIRRPARASCWRGWLARWKGCGWQGRSASLQRLSVRQRLSSCRWNTRF
jgi:hypothetical protein